MRIYRKLLVVWVRLASLPLLLGHARHSTPAPTPSFSPQPSTQPTWYQSNPYRPRFDPPPPKKTISPSVSPSASPTLSTYSAYVKSNQYGDSYSSSSSPKYLVVREEDAQGNTMTIKAECDYEDIPTRASIVSEHTLLYEYSLVVENNANPVTIAKSIETNLAHLLWQKMLNNCEYNTAGWGKTLRYLSVSTAPADYVSRNCDRRYRFSSANCYVIAAGITVEVFFVDVYNYRNRRRNLQQGLLRSQGNRRMSTKHYSKISDPDSTVSHEVGQMLAIMFAENTLLDGIKNVQATEFMGFTNAGVWYKFTSTVETYGIPMLGGMLALGTVYILLMGKRTLAAMQPKLDLSCGKGEEGYYAEAPIGTTVASDSLRQSVSPGLTFQRWHDEYAPSQTGSTRGGVPRQIPFPPVKSTGCSPFQSIKESCSPIQSIKESFQEFSSSSSPPQKDGSNGKANDDADGETFVDSFFSTRKNTVYDYSSEDNSMRLNPY